MKACDGILGLGRLVPALLAAALLLPGVARAQSFDCREARSPVEHTICDTPELCRLDSEMAAAFPAALARDQVGAQALRQSQRQWAAGRAACFRPDTPGGDPRRCLQAAYAARLAALGTTLPAPGPATAAAPPATAPPAPAPAAPAPAASASPTPAGTPDFATPRPATGLPQAPAAAGTLERDRFPTAGETDVLLHVTVPGRFAVRASSPTGTALELVDMLTGPGEQRGWPGRQDGRIDALLDIGTYKLRVRGDKAASGETRLSLAGFSEPGPTQFAPGYRPVATTLSDLQLRSFWLQVPEGAGMVRIEAAGRSMAALALWRDGRDLVELPASTDLVGATPTHPLTDIVLSGPLPPGAYLVTAYGGPKLPWADGAAEEPLYVRTGLSDELVAGGPSGAVGPFGNEAFRVPPGAAQALLTLPQPAEASLHATGAGGAVADLAMLKTDRRRQGLIDLPGPTDKERTLTLRAAPGLAFSLAPVASRKAVDAASLQPVPEFEPGPWMAGAPAPDHAWIGVQELSAGGDEAPAAAVLLRLRPDHPETPELVAAPGVPSIGPGTAWRVRFNLRGETWLLFHVTAGMTVALQGDGLPFSASVTTPEGSLISPAGNSAWLLAAGWYRLRLTLRHAPGLLDLTLGPPGLIPSGPAAAGPEAPVLSFGEVAQEKKARFATIVNGLAGADARLFVRPVPVEVTDFPLLETLAAGETATRRVGARAAGTLVLRDVATGARLQSRPVAAGDTAEIVLPAAPRARTLAVALLPGEAASQPAPQPAPQLPQLLAGTPAFLTLDRGGSAEFAVSVAQGGLYQVQTLGRLRTSGRIGTSFIPDLGTATANGAGANMLLQRHLRAGQYRLEVAARGSAGRLGVVAAPAAFATGAPLLPGGSARATLTPGQGVVFPIGIEAEGRYRLEVLGDGRQFPVRLEDADGWPLHAAGPVRALEQPFAPGQYRLFVEPVSVSARVVARLQRIEPPPDLSGHGPHELPFEAPQALEWREPARQDAPRIPDIWTFALAGPTTVTLSLSGDGMSASLEADPPRPGGPAGRVLAGTPLSLGLPPGHYRVVARSLVRDDRLPYTITLHSDALQPEVPRKVTLPADLPFAIAAGGVVALTSFGPTPLRAELRDAAGTVLERAAGRSDDWNIAVSRALPPGRYHLLLSALAPAGRAQAAADVAEDTHPDTGGERDRGETEAEEQNARDQNPQDPDAPDQNPQDQGAPDQNPQDKGAQDQGAQDQGSAAEQSAGTTEITLALPPDRPPAPLPESGGATLSGGGVQHVLLPAPPSGGLLVVAAEAPVEIILALERKQADGGWRTAGQSQGLAPLLAIPDAGGGEWRASLWAVDGGAARIRLAAHVIGPGGAAPIGTVSLDPVPLPWLAGRWFAAAVDDPGGLALQAAAGDRTLLAATTPGQPAAPPPPNMILAQAGRVWLLSSTSDEVRLAVVRPDPATTLAVALPAGGQAVFPAGAGPCAFVASSGLGRPGLDAGLGMGSAPGSALAWCHGLTLRAWNAGAEAPLPLGLRRIALDEQPEQSVDEAFSGVLPPRSSLLLHLPAGAKRIDASLAAATALIAGSAPGEALTAWAGEAALSRTLTGTWTEITLVNTGETPAPVALAALPEAAVPRLAPGAVFHRFFGAAGSFAVPVAAAPGQRLMVAGPADATVEQPGGRILEGTAVALDGVGTAVVTHGPGAVALWIEGQGVSPWPEAVARAVSLPARLDLRGKAMALRLSSAAPRLLHLSSSGPVILALGDDPPRLYGGGATLARYLPAGESLLHLLPAEEGPLSSTLDLSGTQVIPAAEGLGPAVAIPPGGAALFGFTVTTGGPVGLGVRADPDRVTVRLLDEGGTTLQSGIAMLRTLPPGRYLLEARVPPDAPTTLARPAVLGIAPHPNPPPAEVIRRLLTAAGLVAPEGAPKTGP